jgi:dienelactone hydrolase
LKNKQSFYLAFLLVAFLNTIMASESPEENPIRYRHLVFENVIFQKDVLYGANKTQGGSPVDLYMDVYMPAGDTCTARPVVILAHGGYYLYGSKENFSYDCVTLAKAGYIAASINYRLIDVSESQGSYKRATADAVNDMKAAVRFFRRDKSTQNFFNADTSNIFIGGYSAGAITSLHYAYCTTPREVFAIGGPQLVVYMTIHGGNQGDSGNPGYSSAVRGVINIAGSIHAAWMTDIHEPRLFSVHGTADDIVPFEVGKSGDSGVRTEGSGLVHQRAGEIGLINQLHSIEGAGHAAYFECDSCPAEMRKFIFENLDK